MNFQTRTGQTNQEWFKGIQTILNAAPSKGEYHPKHPPLTHKSAPIILIALLA